MTFIRDIVRCSIAFAGVILLNAPGAAGAANADVQVTVVPQPSSVSVKREGLNTYAAYIVTVQSNTTNVINQAVFSGAASVSGAAAGDTATYVETVPASACASTSATSVQCNIGQLRGVSDPVGSKASFAVILKAPGSGSRIDFNWSFTYSNGASPTSTPSTVASFGGTTSTTLTTASTAQQLAGLTSYFPSGGGTFFTAFPQPNVVGGVATSAAAWTTSVVIPNQVTPNTVTVAQTIALESCSSDVTVCNQSDITIPNQSFNGLTIILRRDASTIRPGAKISNAVVFYRHLPTASPIQLHSCSLGGPTAGVPCIASTTAYTKKNAPTPDFIGDWEFVISAVDNGRFSN